MFRRFPPASLPPYRTIVIDLSNCVCVCTHGVANIHIRLLQMRTLPFAPDKVPLRMQHTATYSNALQYTAPHDLCRHFSSKNQTMLEVAKARHTTYSTTPTHIFNVFLSDCTPSTTQTCTHTRMHTYNHTFLTCSHGTSMGWQHFIGALNC